jgi:hypothetical protein
LAASADMKKTFAGPARGVGASYAWQGNGDVGKGKLTILEQEELHIRYKLEFIEPSQSVADSEFVLAGGGENTKLT